MGAQFTFLSLFWLIFDIFSKFFLVKVIGVQSNHGVEYFGGPASPRLFAVEGPQQAKRAVGKGL